MRVGRNGRGVDGSVGGRLLLGGIESRQVVEIEEETCGRCRSATEPIVVVEGRRRTGSAVVNEIGDALRLQAYNWETGSLCLTDNLAKGLGTVGEDVSYVDRDKRQRRTSWERQRCRRSRTQRQAARPS